MLQSCRSLIVRERQLYPQTQTYKAYVFCRKYPADTTSRLLNTVPAPEATEARAGNCLRTGEAGRELPAIEQLKSLGWNIDTYVIVDGESCYQSGASFKDGARKSPTTLTQITDAFPAIQQTYEDLWKSATVEI